MSRGPENNPKLNHPLYNLTARASFSFRLSPSLSLSLYYSYAVLCRVSVILYSVSLPFGTT